VRRYTVTDGIVIRRMPLPSGDLVVTLLSHEGKWRGVARKGKLPGGNLGKLSLFHDVTLQYYRKRDEDLALITQVQLGGALTGLSRPDVYPYANLLAELVDALTVDVHLGERVHEYLASGLRGLVKHHDPEHVALIYSWRLLGLAGLAPTVSRCARCGSAGPLVAYDPEAGGLECDGCARRDGPSGGLPPGASASYVGEEGSAELADLVEAPMREALSRPPRARELHWRVLSRHVGYHVRELNSLANLPPAGSAAPVT
jgi:DNA repair protein RecO (recombination protein O)